MTYHCSTLFSNIANLLSLLHYTVLLSKYTKQNLSHVILQQSKCSVVFNVIRISASFILTKFVSGFIEFQHCIVTSNRKRLLNVWTSQNANF